jgi:hypothetical protein
MGFFCKPGTYVLALLKAVGISSYLLKVLIYLCLKRIPGSSPKMRIWRRGWIMSRRIASSRGR